MSITVVGSIAYDAVKTPSGERERMLGGAATHFALAASFFAPVRVVGPVGDDFCASDLAVLQTRGTNTDDVEVVAGGKTFLWGGAYGADLNTRETLATELGVFENFAPQLSAAAGSSDVLFLANIQPGVQSAVLDQCAGQRWRALDSTSLWIDTAREELLAVIERVDCLVLNDAELRVLTGRPTVLAAAREVLRWGPKAVVAKQGEYGCALISDEGYLSLPAVPLESVVDPTGAGDTFAGGLAGYVAAHPDQEVGHELLARGVAYGTALASFNVEEFGTARVARLTPGEIHERLLALYRAARFEPNLVEFVAS